MTKPINYEKRRRTNKIIMIVFAILITPIILIVFLSKDSPAPESVKPFISESAAMVISRHFVEDQLKAPSQAKFSSEYNFTSSDKDSLCSIVSIVDAPNSFGVMLRKKYQVSMKFMGGREIERRNWRLIDIKID